MSLASIPNGIQDKIRRKCFTFLWSRNKERYIIPLVRWSKLAQPKKLGGWVLKYLKVFGKIFQLRFFGE